MDKSNWSGYNIQERRHFELLGQESPAMPILTHRPNRFGLLLACLLGIASSDFVSAREGRQSKLLVALPAEVATPDGMAVDLEGNLVVACPNFGDSARPSCLMRIDKSLHVTRWVDVPTLPDTGRACPMGIEFGPDGDLYVCDNQNWADGNGPQGQRNQGRLLRLRIREGRVAKTTVVARSISHPNGVRVHGEHVFITVSMLPKVQRPDGLLTSAVYRFRLDDENIELTNSLSDPNLLVSFVTRNRDCQYGVDGLVFDSQGNLFVGNFGDGTLNKVTFDRLGKPTGATVLAQTDFNTPLTDPNFRDKMVPSRMRTTDGMCIDSSDNIYVADFSNNAVCKVSPQGTITVLAQSPDCRGIEGGLDQPGEPILWNGKLVVSCFDMVTGPDKVNTQHNLPCALVWLEP